MFVITMSACEESVQVAPPSVDFQTCTSESGLVGEKQRVPM